MISLKTRARLRVSLLSLIYRIIFIGYVRLVKDQRRGGAEGKEENKGGKRGGIGREKRKRGRGNRRE